MWEAREKQGSGPCRRPSCQTMTFGTSRLCHHTHMSLPKFCFRIAKIGYAVGRPRGGSLEVICDRRSGPHSGRHPDLFTSCPGRRAETPGGGSFATVVGQSSRGGLGPCVNTPEKAGLFAARGDSQAGACSTSSPPSWPWSQQ